MNEGLIASGQQARGDSTAVSVCTFGCFLQHAYVDLTVPLRTHAPIHVNTLRAAYDHMLDGNGAISFQISPPLHLRDSILKESKLEQYICVSPSTVPEELYSTEWRHLVDNVNHWKELNTSTKLKLVFLLGKLSLYEAVLKLLPPADAAVEAGNLDKARLLLRRSQAAMAVTPQAASEANEQTAIIATTARDYQARIIALIALVTHHAKKEINVSSLTELCERLQTEVDRLERRYDKEDSILLSKAYRSLAFGPFHRNEPELVRARLEKAEFYSDNISVNATLGEQLQAENRHPLYETLSKEAAWLGNYDLALYQNSRLLAHDPNDPKVRIQAGDLLQKCGRLTEALAQYQKATGLGPPLTAISHYKVGRMLEALGRLDEAAASYMTSATFDCRNPVTLLRLRRLLLLLDNVTALQWCESALLALKGGQS